MSPNFYFDDNYFFFVTASINIDIVVITGEPTNYTHLAIGLQIVWNYSNYTGR